MTNQELINAIIEKVGGEDNILRVSHCMTRLRFKLKDEAIAKTEEIKDLEDISAVVQKGGQYQVVIGPKVSSVFDELVKMYPQVGNDGLVDNDPEDNAVVKKDIKYYLNNVMSALAECMTPLLPIFLASGFIKALASMLGPDLLNVISTESDLYTLLTVAGDAGMYFMPIIVANTAAKRFGMSPVLAMVLGAVLVYPTFVNMALSSPTQTASFKVYGIPTMIMNYSNTLLPILFTVILGSFVEKLANKWIPDVIKIFAVPMAVILIMLPFELCLFAPLGTILGSFLANAIIALYNVAGPLAVAIIGGTFSLLVMSGMHVVLFGFLFSSFFVVGYDGFLMPGMLACSWSALGVAIACLLKFKDKKKRTEIIGYIVTWALGGVGEPMLYGLNIRYKTPLYANIVAGAVSGLIIGLLGLKAYVLNPSNGLSGLMAFMGGPRSNYTVLIISLVLSVAAGFLCMLPLKVKTEKDA